mmetsp:Transcript_17370/g.48352  ORF Transcript_17370/g.48352 Transcript_17370/m.48352 type:complete len:214 (-) Transcript_17370:1699-2340(-)
MPRKDDETEEFSAPPCGCTGSNMLFCGRLRKLECRRPRVAQAVPVLLLGLEGVERSVAAVAEVPGRVRVEISAHALPLREHILLHVLVDPQLGQARRNEHVLLPRALALRVPGGVDLHGAARYHLDRTVQAELTVLQEHPVLDQVVLWDCLDNLPNPLREEHGIWVGLDNPVVGAEMPVLDDLFPRLLEDRGVEDSLHEPGLPTHLAMKVSVN